MSDQTTVPTDAVDELVRALYGLAALRRDLQRCAGVEHAVAGLAMLGVVRRVGPARVSDVARETQVDLSVASRHIQALQDEGLVDRVADPHDGRSSLIAISEAGEAKLGRAHARLTGVLAAATDDWRPDEVAGLASGLVRLRAALGDGDERDAAPVGAARDDAAPAEAGRPARAAARPPATRPPATRPPATRPPAAGSPASAPAPTLPAGRPAADPTLTSADPADARHEEHTR